MTARASAPGTARASGELRRAGATAVIACGALAVHVHDIARRRGWAVDVHPLPALLHNRPERIAGVAPFTDRHAVAAGCLGEVEPHVGELDQLLQ